MAGLEHGSSFIMSDSCLDMRGSSDFPTTSGRQNNPVLDETKEKACKGTEQVLKAVRGKSQAIRQVQSQKSA